MKEKIIQKKDSDAELPSPFTDRAYNITIEVNNQQDLPIPERWSFTFHVSELSRKIFFAIFDLVASECLKDNYTENTKDEFSNISSSLFKNFNLDNLSKQGSLEDSIKEYIRKLEKYHFFLPKTLVTEKRDHTLTIIQPKLLKRRSLAKGIAYLDQVKGINACQIKVIHIINEILHKSNFYIPLKSC